MMVHRRFATALATVALATAALATGASTASAQVERPFARFPAVSPDGRTVAFSYQGDIWTVPIDGGRPYRLTIHEAYEAHPRWSPDGSRIAFTSDRFGNDDVWVMDADGGAPRRLTHHSSTDRLGSWTPDGDLVFTTSRTYVQAEWSREFYRVSTGGGTPTRLLDATGYTPAVSPDGRFIAFTFGSNGEQRKGYRGEANKEVWLYDNETGEYSAFTDFEGNDMRPAWGGARTLFFISERDGAYNLYRVAVGDDGSPAGEPERLTGFADDGPRYFGVDASGGTIVFERETDVYVLDVAGREQRRLAIRVPADDRFDPMERRTYTDEARQYAVSPNGERIAFVVRGEVFVMQNDPDERRAVRLTDHAYRDRDVAWLSDTTLVFASDRGGQYDLYRLESADPDEPDLFESLEHRVVRLTETPEDEADPVVSPDGGGVAFERGRGTLIVADVENGTLAGETVLLDGWATPSGIAWSPDSEWLAYGLDDLNFNAEVYIHAADGSRGPVNVTMHPKADGSPVWSADGRKLGFISERNNGDGDVWFVWLRRADWEMTRSDWEQLDDEADAAADEGEDEAGEDDVPAVEIDFDRIHERLVQVTSMPGGEGNIAVSGDGETFFFTGGPDGDLYSVKWDGTEQEALTSGGANAYAVRLGPEGERLYMMKQGGRLARLTIDGGRQESLGFAARMDIDYRAEAAQIFDEAWRVLDAGFYDPDFHGDDWSALRAKYRPWALRASTRRDFRDVFNMMLGELNASHVGLYGGDRAETQDERTGRLGIEVAPVDGGVRVEHVVPGSPADRAASTLRRGDVIAAVDGRAVTADVNVWSLFADRVDERTVLSVRGADGDEREVVIRPVGSLGDELYEEWVEERRRLTEEYSDGRLGYIHIEGMNWPSFERFEREIVASGQGREGLVIDVRYNGGGWTTDYLLAVLDVRQHAYTIPRGATDDLERDHLEYRDHYPFGPRRPLATWTGPTIALANANSYSNAEIFSHAFKTLGLGTLVGTPTFGAVISTGGAGLIDGSFVRLPFRAWYVRATDENMENGPAVPDIYVPMRPDYRADGEDAQLRAAVDELLRQIDGGVATEQDDG